MSTKEQVLALLMQAEDSVSGEALAQKLGITRSHTLNIIHAQAIAADAFVGSSYPAIKAILAAAIAYFHNSANGHAISENPALKLARCAAKRLNFFALRCAKKFCHLLLREIIWLFKRLFNRSHRWLFFHARTDDATIERLP